MRTVAAICRELTSDHRTDGELLAAFRSERSEAAFLELVRRHGPLVWAACQRLLPDPADAEDAFQAAFLVLVRRAHRLAHRDAVGPWLYRVAVWTARNVRRKNARRLARQQPLPEHIPVSLPDSDLKADIDKALLALPARYRDSIVLCHLQGFTRREAAERLGCAEGTLSAWLSRGLAKLRTRLGDLNPAKAVGVAAAVPAALTATTARAAVAASHAALVTPAVSSLVEGVLHMLWMKKATAAALAVCAVFALGVGVGLGTRAEHSGATAKEKAVPMIGTVPKAEPPEPAKKPEVIETLLRAKETAYSLTLDGFWIVTQRVETAKAAGANPKSYQEDIEALERIQQAAKVLAAEVKELRAALAKLKGEAVKPERGYLVLTVSGKAGEPLFAIREMPADDKKLGAQKRPARPSPPTPRRSQSCWRGRRPTRPGRNWRARSPNRRWRSAAAPRRR